MADLVPADSNIRLIHLGGDPLTIGEKRNFGCEHALGSVICHWDDDDWSGPSRVEDQVTRLADSGLSVTGYHSMRFTDGAQWWQYSGDLSFSLGTSLMYKRHWWASHKFLGLQVGEDAAFVEAAWIAGQLSTEDANGMMYASVHPANTSPRNMGTKWTVI